MTLRLQLLLKSVMFAKYSEDCGKRNPSVGWYPWLCCKALPWDFCPFTEDFIFILFFMQTFPVVLKNAVTVLVFKKAAEPLLVIIGLLPFSVIFRR
jgi:hypothetical protein